MIEINLAPDIITKIGPLNITSGHMGLFLVTIFLALYGFVNGRKASVVPSRIQVFNEMIINWFDEKVKMSTPKKYQKLNLTLTLTTFLIILVANLISFIPIIGQIKYDEAFLFYTPTAHLSFPLVLGIFLIGLGQLIALFSSPFRHIGNYIKFHEFLKVRSLSDFFNACIEFFLGIMDIIGELAKVISISNRLFGNMLSGVLMTIVIVELSEFTQFLAPIPFNILGLLAAVIQAVVFALLSALFFGSTLEAIQPKKA